MNSPLLLSFQSPRAGYSLTFEDDGRVAYAYLKKEGKIVGDVWLYNRCPTPKFPEWDDRAKIPFANSKDYISEAGRMTRSVSKGDVLVSWECSENGPTAYIYLFEDLYGAVSEGERPGYARFATADGPLARKMRIVNSGSDPKM